MRMSCAPCFAVPVRTLGRAGMSGTWARSTLACVLVSMSIGNAWADVGAETTGELKHMSVEELMDIQVTSVARHPESLRQAAAAIQVGHRLSLLPRCGGKRPLNRLSSHSAGSQPLQQERLRARANGERYST